MKLAEDKMVYMNISQSQAKTEEDIHTASPYLTIIPIITLISYHNI